jgi:hypothetical protein
LQILVDSIGNADAIQQMDTHRKILSQRCNVKSIGDIRLWQTKMRTKPFC